jgi:GWxTD domain-containing protein
MARGLALHRLGRSAEAEPAFDSALALLPEQTRREMTSLGRILREKAAADYEKVGPAARAQLDSLYWDVADPLILAPGNEARAEFLSRVAYADLRFSSAEFHHEGWRTDRGVIYARYGPPTRIATFMSGDVNRTAGFDPDNEGGGFIATNDPTGNVARITTVWWWEPTNLAIVFTGPPAMNSAWYADDFRAYAESVRETQPVRLENPAALPIDSIGVQVARFRPDPGAARAEGDVDVAIYADVPSARLLEDVDVTGAPVVTAFTLRDDANHKLAAAQDSLVPGDAVTTRTWRALLPRGAYVYRVEALQPASGKAARGRGAFDAAPIPASGLALSDILVARSVVPRSVTTRPHGRADFAIQPNGSLTFPRGDSIYVYWEEYGLTPDPTTGAGRSRVELSLHLDQIDRTGQFIAIRVLGGIADVAQLSPEGDDRVSLRFERAVPLDGTDRAPSFLGIALGDAPYGRYTLELTVTDLVTGKSVRRERVVRVPRP